MITFKIIKMFSRSSAAASFMYEMWEIELLQHIFNHFKHKILHYEKYIVLIMILE